MNLNCHHSALEISHPNFQLTTSPCALLNTTNPLLKTFDDETDMGSTRYGLSTYGVGSMLSRR